MKLRKQVRVTRRGLIVIGIAFGISMSVVLAGAGLNRLAMWANGGCMPVSDSLLMGLTWPHYVPASTARLSFLGDIFWGWSVGDFTMIVGAVLFPALWAWRACSRSYLVHST